MFVLDQSDKFYFRLGNLSGTTQNRIAGYFRIERIKIASEKGVFHIQQPTGRESHPFLFLFNLPNLKK